VYFFPVSNKPFKYAFDFPIEAIWLRPIRVQSAKSDADRVAHRLTQAGLDLMRDVRQGYADVVLAKERVRISEEAVQLRERVAGFAQKRLDAGDIAPQEAATARIEALQARQNAARVAYELPILEERLRNLMGIGALREPFVLDLAPPPDCQEFDAQGLTRDAMASRPDAIAAAAAVDAAEARVRFAKIGWVRLLGIADATSGTATGHEFGPALRFTVPLFHHNQGAIARAEAEFDRAVRNQATVEQQIMLDVQRAYLQYRQSCVELEILETKVRPEVQAAIQRAEAAYREGDVTIFIVLETTRQLLDNYLREAQLKSDVRRYWAELERSVGKRLGQSDLASVPGVERSEAPSVTDADSLRPSNRVGAATLSAPLLELPFGEENDFVAVREGVPK
jgi:cobalt-zinc-cadmium efflux system outer membrane protein